MKKLIKYLSSLKLTTILLVLLVIILLSGGFLTRWDSIYYGFKDMNHLITLDWFLNFDSHHPVIITWFFVLCIVAVLFGINLVLCTADYLMKFSVKKKSTYRSLLFIVHIVFVIILLMHALSLVVGFKQGDIVLTQGESYELDNGYIIKVDEIHYIDNEAFLKKGKKSHRLEMTLDAFHYKENYAKISLFNNKRIVVSGKACIFSPVFGKGYQLTLDKFVFDKKSGKPAVILTVGKNPLTWYFFAFYALGIFTLLLLLLFRWRKI